MTAATAATPAQQGMDARERPLDGRPRWMRARWACEDRRGEEVERRGALEWSLVMGAVHSGGWVVEWWWREIRKVG